MAKSFYWAVVSFDGGIHFEGTHLQCWDYLFKHFRHLTLGQCDERGIRIARIK